MIFKTYIKRSMYPINPYIHEEEPNIPVEALVAPTGFNPDLQELDITKAFNSFNQDDNKKYIMLISQSVSSTSLPGDDRNYYYSENGGNYTLINSGTTINWTNGSNKRNIIVSSASTNILATLLQGCVWGYLGNGVNKVTAVNNTFLKYIHCASVSSIIFEYPNSFYGCTSLEGQADIRNTTYIPTNLFDGCINITNILLTPSIITTIGSRAFVNCSNATFNNGQPLYFSNVSVIQADSFYNCQKLSEIVDFRGSTFTHLPDYYGTFRNCYSLKKMYLPLVLTTLGSYGGDGIFANCVNLDYINTQECTELSLIYSAAFGGCNKLLDLYIPDKVKALNGGVVPTTCLNLRLPSGLEVIQNGALWDRQNLNFNTNNELTLNSLTLLGQGAFGLCKKLKKLDVSGTSIEYFDSYYDTFYICSGLETLLFPPSTKRLGKAGADGFVVNCNNLSIVNFNQLINLEEICVNSFISTKLNTIDLSLTKVHTIRQGCFAYSSYTTIIKLPSTIQLIEKNSFTGCSNVQNYYIYALTAPTVETGAFSGNGAKPLHVPIGATGYDVAPWTNTSIFSNIIYDL